jgi:hypothetical protein
VRSGAEADWCYVGGEIILLANGTCMLIQKSLTSCARRSVYTIVCIGGGRGAGHLQQQ